MIKKYLLVLLATICLIPFNVHASGNVSVSKSSLTITKGKSATFKITASNSAGRINISTSDSNIASVSQTSVFLDMQSTTITVKGVSTGIAKITVHLADVTTYDDENISGKKYTITVKVNELSSGSNTNNNTSLSKNNNIKSLLVEGYDLKKIDNHNYSLEVGNDVNKITVVATAEHSKAKVSGVGEHNLNIGENSIKIVVTSESGLLNTILIKVKRKDGFYLEDLKKVLTDSNIQEANIIINADSTISVADLTAIKESKKNIALNFYDQNKKIIYSWILNGSQISSINSFSTAVSFASKYDEKISELSNYASGKLLHFEHDGKLPQGTKIKLYVGEIFDESDAVNMYAYDQESNNLQLTTKGLLVKEGYIEVDIKKAADYFITKSNVSEKSVSKTGYKTTAIVELVVILGILIMDYLKINPILKLNKKNNK